MSNINGIGDQHQAHHAHRTHHAEHSQPAQQSQAPPTRDAMNPQDSYCQSCPHADAGIYSPKMFGQGK
ncbi:MAG: hypothetical protein ACYCW6_04380 [Candidatus Xenobia bacterium]